ncbi:MAG: iron-sulfur cluster repair di-iron protein [Ignavibacteriaceae bacterium]|nr:iron-sulfur cluster repair di-iron protein [Ignavibacteriaceae bacterium]
MGTLLDTNKTIGQIVKDDFRAAEVFKKFGIDFCCGGKITIDEACASNSINKEELMSLLETNLSKAAGSNAQNFKDWEPDFLTNYIINVHHKYVNDNLTLLYEFTQKIAYVHGQRHPELLKVAENYAAVAQELSNHMMKEERILFPYIIQLYSAYKKQEPATESPFGSIRNPIKMMEMEHENAGGLLKEMREITSDYTLPYDACNTYTVTFKKLDEFENDLHQHIHLENNILFPRAIEIEDEMQGVK